MHGTRITDTFRLRYGLIYMMSKSPRMLLTVAEASDIPGLLCYGENYGKRFRKKILQQ